MEINPIWDATSGIYTKEYIIIRSASGKKCVSFNYGSRMTSAAEPHANEADSIPLTAHVRGAPITGGALQNTSLQWCFPSPFYPSWNQPNVSDAALKEQMRNTGQSFLHHGVCGKLLWWKQCPWVRERHRFTREIENIRSVLENCVFLALRFSEEHMEALICWLTGGIRSALRRIKIPPAWRCECVWCFSAPQ